MACWTCRFLGQHQRHQAPRRDHRPRPACRPAPRRGLRDRRRSAPAYRPVRDQRPDRHPLLRWDRPAGIRWQPDAGGRRRVRGQDRVHLR